ncbi:MAG: PA4780 family RIO1-like protein kinase [bacterium]
MRMPARLVPLIEYGVIDSVVRSLLSGKEAQVFLVDVDGELCAAKVYKDQESRSFRQRSTYTEGRTVRNSRDQRAMAKGSRHGKERAEETWKSKEVEVIYKLDAAGVRVPKPRAFVDGVLIMECVIGLDGEPAPRLADCSFNEAEGEVLFERLIGEVVKMLCAGIVHGDLSEFNVLIDANGPVIIDFPQAVDAAGNSHAKEILLRDVANLIRRFKRGQPSKGLRHGWEMWDLYERGELTPDSKLTGHFDLPAHIVNADSLLQEMREIEEAEVLERVLDGPDFDSPRSSGPRSGRGKQKPGPVIAVRGQLPPVPIFEPETEAAQPTKNAVVVVAR